MRVVFPFNYENVCKYIVIHRVIVDNSYYAVKVIKKINEWAQIINKQLNISII